MPLVTTGASAQGVACFLPTAAARENDGSVPNNLQRVENAQGVGGSLRRPCAGTATPAVAPGNGMGIDAPRGQAFAHFLEQTHPNLSSATRWLVEGDAAGSFRRFSADQDRDRARYEFACATTHRLTLAGEQALKYSHGLFRLTELGYDTIERPRFDDFARDLELDPTVLLRALGHARNNLPVGSSVRLPRVVSVSGDAGSRRPSIDPRGLDLPRDFIHYLDVVNPALASALDWIQSDPKSRPATTVQELAITLDLGSTLSSYVRNTPDGAILSWKGCGAVECELAARAWIQSRLPRSMLPDFARSLGIYPAKLSLCVTKALDRLDFLTE